MVKNPNYNSKRSRAKGRGEIEEVYGNLEFKRDLHNDFIHDRNKNIYSAFYAGLDPRRKKEMADGGMISEDKNAMSNLPPEGFQREYPSRRYSNNPYFDDSITE